MTRRLIALIALLLPLACSAADEPAATFKLKEHYMPARMPQIDPNPEQTDVVEVFWYGCGHCYKFDPLIENWVKNRKPASVNFTRMPSSLGRPQGLLHSKAYYTAEALGVLDEMHHALFDALHRQRRPLNTPQDIQALFVENGVNPETFNSTFNSFIVDSKVQQAEATIRGLGITSVPTLVVDNTYWTGGPQAGGFSGMLEVVDFLIARAAGSS